MELSFSNETLANLSASEIYTKYTRSERLRKILIGAALFVSLILYVAILRTTAPMAILAVLAVLLILALLNGRMDKTRTQGLRNILTANRDPEKLGELYRVFMDKRKGNPTSALKLLTAESDFYSGNYSDTNAAIHELFMNKWPVEHELLFDQIWGYHSYVKNHKKDWDEAQKDFSLLYRDAQARKKHGDAIDRVFQSFLALIHLENQEFEQAKQVLQERISNGEEPYMEVFDSYWLAKAYIGLGETEAAKKLLEYVSLTGNTMAVKKDADKLLAELG